MSICDLLRDVNTAEYGLAGAASIFPAHGLRSTFTNKLIHYPNLGDSAHFVDCSGTARRRSALLGSRGEEDYFGQRSDHGLVREAPGWSTTRSSGLRLLHGREPPSLFAPFVGYSVDGHAEIRPRMLPPLFPPPLLRNP
jgi:hypothetical protein